MKSQKFCKSPVNVLYSYVHLRSLITRIHIYIHVYFFNQTTVFVSFKVYNTRVDTEV